MQSVQAFKYFICFYTINDVYLLIKKNWKVYYYEMIKGDCPVMDYINSLPARNRAKILAVIGQLE